MISDNADLETTIPTPEPPDFGDLGEQMVQNFQAALAEAVPEPEPAPIPETLPESIWVKVRVKDLLAMDAPMNAEQIVRYDGPSGTLTLNIQRGECLLVTPENTAIIAQLTRHGHTFTAIS